jgi:hypothetical protein
MCQISSTGSGGRLVLANQAGEAHADDVASRFFGDVEHLSRRWLTTSVSCVARAAIA